MPEELMAKKVNGIVVTVPATGVSFYIEREKTLTGAERTRVSPLVMRRGMMEGIVEAIRERVARKRKEVVE